MIYTKTYESCGILVQSAAHALSSSLDSKALQILYICLKVNYLASCSEFWTLVSEDSPVASPIGGRGKTLPFTDAI